MINLIIGIVGGVIFGYLFCYFFIRSKVERYIMNILKKWNDGFARDNDYLSFLGSIDKTVEKCFDDEMKYSLKGRIRNVLMEPTIILMLISEINKRQLLNKE